MTRSIDIAEVDAALVAGRWRQVADRLAGAGDEAGPEVLAALAWAQARLGDPKARSTVDRALVLDVRNLRAALLKADILAPDPAAQREANLYYRGVIDIAAGRSGLPDDLAKGVARARAFRDRVVGGMTAQLTRELAAGGYDAARSSPRFTHALDLAMGRRQPYVQQPQAFYFPELPNTQFYPREQFPWLDEVEAATDEITAELEAILRGDDGFEPYLVTVPNLPSRSDYPLVDSMDWSSCFLWRDGRETAFAARCPRTMAALTNAPLCRVGGRSPQIMFSQLKAGAHIKPHTGFVNTRLICHLPLIVPEGCRFRVGNDVREWRRGRAWVFDDSIEHEAINTSDRTRVVLIFDIWRPELTVEERGLVTTLLETLDAYSPTSTPWE